MSKAKAARPRIALALAGGGPLGAIHEIGALCALDEALEGIDFSRLQHYVGVSAGGFLAAALANGMQPRQLCAAFIDDQQAGPEIFDPAWLMVPAWGEFAQRAARLPAAALSALWTLAWRRQPLAALERLGAAVPTGLFSSEQVHRQLTRVFSQDGRSNDFRQLRTQLTLVATDLDTGEAVPFGRPGWDAVPISRAVQASAAMPGLFPPVEIAGRSYVDGALRKTLHASVALEQGVDLLICLNPLRPFRAGGAIPRIAQGGLPAVLGQTLRALIHSRLAPAMKHYALAHPRTDVVLLEPDPGDGALHQANTFGYRQRRELAEHAYQQTRAWLRSQGGALAPRLARHGITLRHGVLEGPGRRLLPPAPARPRLAPTLDALRHALDDLEQRLQPA